MKIAVISSMEEPVPPLKYGGTELVISNVVEGLVKRGHEVHLIASGDSKTSAHLIPLVEKSVRELYGPDEIEQWRTYLRIVKAIEVARYIRELKPDVVHNHIGWRLIAFDDFIEPPMVSTLHGPITSFNERRVLQDFPRSGCVSISNNQRKAMPNVHWLKTIYNGIDTSKFHVGTDERSYFVFLGRTSPEKGLAEICKLIKGTNHKLKIGAKVDKVDIEYFENEVRPYIDGEQIEFLGEIGHEEKVTLLKGAKGLLLWLNWEEPFGLVVTEAMACGTPVIANRRGAMPEIIVDGKTGYLVNTLEEMKERLNDVESISAEECRAHVEKHFSIETMVDGYESLFADMVKGKVA